MTNEMASLVGNTLRGRDYCLGSIVSSAPTPPSPYLDSCGGLLLVLQRLHLFFLSCPPCSPVHQTPFYNPAMGEACLSAQHFDKCSLFLKKFNQLLESLVKSFPSSCFCTPLTRSRAFCSCAPFQTSPYGPTIAYHCKKYGKRLDSPSYPMLLVFLCPDPRFFSVYAPRI